MTFFHSFQGFEDFLERHYNYNLGSKIFLQEFIEDA